MREDARVLGKRGMHETPPQQCWCSPRGGQEGALDLDSDYAERALCLLLFGPNLGEITRGTSEPTYYGNCRRISASQISVLPLSPSSAAETRKRRQKTGCRPPLSFESGLFFHSLSLSPLSVKASFAPSLRNRAVIRRAATTSSVRFSTWPEEGSANPACPVLLTQTRVVKAERKREVGVGGKLSQKSGSRHDVSSMSRSTESGELLQRSPRMPVAAFLLVRSPVDCGFRTT